MTPEQKAREEIDKQLAACGWLVQNHKAMNASAHSPSKVTRLRKGKAVHDRRVVETGNTGPSGKKKASKRDFFAELAEGFDALKRERDA